MQDVSKVDYTGTTSNQAHKKKIISLTDDKLNKDTQFHTVMSNQDCKTLERNA